MFEYLEEDRESEESIFDWGSLNEDEESEVEESTDDKAKDDGLDPSVSAVLKEKLAEIERMKAEAEAQIKRDKEELGRRQRERYENALSSIGAKLDENGKVVISDVGAYLKSIGQTVGKDDRPVELPDVYAQPDEFVQFMTNLASSKDTELTGTFDQKLQAIVEKEIAPLKEHYQKLIGHVSTQVAREHTNLAKQNLERYMPDYVDIANDPKYQQIYSEAVNTLTKDTFGGKMLSELSDEEKAYVCRFATLVSVPTWEDRGGKKPPRRRNAADDAARNALTSVGSSRGSYGSFTKEDAIRIRDTARQLGFDDPEEYLALQDPTGEEYRKYKEKKRR